jgi:integrase/recombinase XerD
MSQSVTHVSEHLLPMSPVYTPVKGDIPQTFTRRHFLSKELNRLLANASKSETVHGLTGEQRMYLYLVASGTSYRAHELSSVTPASFKLDAAAPYLEVVCTISNRRTLDRQELRPQLAAQLRPFLAGKPVHERLWDGGWWRKACKIMQENDLEGIAKETDEGLLQFHSLRHSYITSIVSTGANQRLALEICRLSDPKLLDGYYRATAEDRTRTIKAVPMPHAPKARGGRKAG